MKGRKHVIELHLPLDREQRFVKLDGEDITEGLRSVTVSGGLSATRVTLEFVDVEIKNSTIEVEEEL